MDRLISYLIGDYQYLIYDHDVDKTYKIDSYYIIYITLIINVIFQ